MGADKTVYTSSRGEFTLTLEGKAAYLYDVNEDPPDHFKVTAPDVAEAFEKRRKAMWDAVIVSLDVPYYLLRAFRYKGDYDALVNDVGIPALMKAVKTYDPSKGASFNSHAVTTCRGAFYGYFIGIRRRAEVERIAGSKRHSIEPDPSDERETRDIVQSLLASISESDRQVLILKFILGMTMAEIGEVAGVAEGTAHVMVHTALRACREESKKAKDAADKACRKSVAKRLTGDRCYEN